MVGLTGQKLLLPFYHCVSDKIPLHLKYLYPPRKIITFKKDLAYLLKHYQPVDLQELIKLKKENKPPKKKCFHLTFDDGLSEFYDVVAPILKAKGIPATIFVNTDFMDNKNLFYRFKASLLIEKIYAKGLLDLSYQDVKILDELAQENDVDFDDYLKTVQPYLSTQQLEKLIQQGFTVGAHSLNHPLYKKISFNNQLQQTLESIDLITSKFNLNYKVFSFPFTDDAVGKDFFSAISSKVDLTFGGAGLKKDIIPFNLQRLAMEDAKKSGKEIIKSAYFYYLLKSFVGKNRIVRV